MYGKSQKVTFQEKQRPELWNFFMLFKINLNKLSVIAQKKSVDEDTLF